MGDSLPADIAERFKTAGERFRAGQLDAAASLLEAVTAEAPAFARAWFLLGFLEGNRGRFDAAAARLERAIALAPGDPEARLFLARAYARLERVDDAVQCYREAIRLAPVNAPVNAAAHAELGALLVAQGREDDAIASLERAVAAEPGSSAALGHLGLALLAAHRPRQAADVLRRAVALDPADAALHCRLGEALRDAGALEESVAALTAGVAAAPRSVALHATLGNVLALAGRGPEAIAALEAALALEPGNADALGWLLREKLQACDWNGLEREQALMRAALDSGGPVLHPLVWCSFSASAAELRRVADRWAAHTLRRVGSARCPVRHPARRQWLRLGYVSSDFRDHAVSRLLAEVIELHDRAAFQVLAYSTAATRSGGMRRRLEGAFDDFVDIAAESDAAAAARIHADEIDILVDLNGYTNGARHGVFARRPAAVLVGYLGFPGTLGTGLMDYLVGDATVTPLELEPHYAEKIVQLPHCFQPNDRQRTVGITQTREAYGLPAQGLVLCCFHQAHKVTPPVLDVWCEALAAAPGAVLWMVESHRAAIANLRAELARRGIDGGRLVVAGYVPRLEDHIARMRCADLFLDTFPYGAHTTCSDALWAGVPVVTLAGETFASRVAASLLRAVGLGELATWSLDEYRALVLDLVKTPPRRAALRARLAAQAPAAPLFDSAGYTRALEWAYAAMRDRAVAGLPPEHIVVPR